MSENRAKPVLLVLTSTYPRWRGDTEPGFVHKLSTHLTESFDVHVLTPHTPDSLSRESIDGVCIHRYRYAPAALETLTHRGGIVSNIKRSPFKLLLLPAFLIAQLIATLYWLIKIRPAVMHAHWIIPQGLVARLALIAYRKPCRFVITSHGTDTHAFRSPVFKALKRYIISRADRILVVSTALKAMLLSDTGLAHDKIDILSMGVDFDTFSPNPATPRAYDELLFVGRLVESKGAADLLQAVATIVQSGRQISLRIVGSGPEEEQLKALTHTLGIADLVTFQGAIENSSLPDLYRRATILVAPYSGEEGLGLVLIEASGCECPVLCTDIPGTRDIVINGQTGISVSPGSPTLLADKITHLLEDAELRQLLARNARTWVTERYSWSTISNKHMQTLLSDQSTYHRNLD